MPFDRWTLGAKTTWAFDLFNDHHAQLNDLYWSYVPAAQVAVRTAKRAAAPGGAAPSVATAFALKGGQDRRMPSDLAAWDQLFKDFDNWVRLSALMALASYLELYMTTVIALALESDPGLLHGCPKQTDGVAYLKRNKAYSLVRHVEPCTKGEWPGRVAAYRTLFDRVPKVLEDAVVELESIRGMRNSVGHWFGRPNDSDGFRNQSKRTAMSRLSEPTLQKRLATVEGVAKAVDEHLGKTHVGAYEWIRFFHFTRSKLDAMNYPKALSRAFATARFTPGAAYCRSLIAYYDRT